MFCLFSFSFPFQSSASSAEIAQLRGSIKQYESLIVEYKVQLEKCRQEIEDSHTRVQDQEMEARRQHQTTIIDNEKVSLVWCPLKTYGRLRDFHPKTGVGEVLGAGDFRL